MLNINNITPVCLGDYNINHGAKKKLIAHFTSDETDRVVSLMGPSGCGKSVLANLVLTAMKYVPNTIDVTSFDNPTEAEYRIMALQKMHTDVTGSLFALIIKGLDNMSAEQSTMFSKFLSSKQCPVVFVFGSNINRTAQQFCKKYTRIRCYALNREECVGIIVRVYGLLHRGRSIIPPQAQDVFSIAEASMGDIRRAFYLTVVGFSVNNCTDRPLCNPFEIVSDIFKPSQHGFDIESRARVVDSCVDREQMVSFVQENYVDHLQFVTDFDSNQEQLLSLIHI
jgi:hypothetical protein